MPRLEAKDIVEEVVKVEDLATEIKNRLYGKKVVVRADKAGVHYGTLVSWEGENVMLENTRNLWRWQAEESISLSAIAAIGAREEGSKFTPWTKEIVIIGVCAIMPCTQQAIATIEAIPNAEQEK